MAKQQTQWRGGSEPRVQAEVVVSGRWGSSPKGTAGPGVRQRAVGVLCSVGEVANWHLDSRALRDRL